MTEYDKKVNNEKAKVMVLKDDENINIQLESNRIE